MTKAVPPDKTELTVYLNKDLKRRFKLECTRDNLFMSNIVEKMIEEWLNERNNSK
jgi:uridine kinase